LLTLCASDYLDAQILFRHCGSQPTAISCWALDRSDVNDSRDLWASDAQLQSMAKLSSGYWPLEQAGILPANANFKKLQVSLESASLPPKRLGKEIARWNHCHATDVLTPLCESSSQALEKTSTCPANAEVLGTDSRGPSGGMPFLNRHNSAGADALA